MKVTHLAEHDAKGEDVHSLIVALSCIRTTTKLDWWAQEKGSEYSERISSILKKGRTDVTVCANKYQKIIASHHGCQRSSYRESSQEPSSRGFPPLCTSSCDRPSSGQAVSPVTASPRACRPPWDETAQSLPPPPCCPTHTKSVLYCIVMLQV